VLRRREATVVRRAAAVAASLGVLQLAVAAAMVLGNLPPVLRSLHQATGVAVWVAAFTLAYLARLASGASSAERAPADPGPAQRAARTAHGAGLASPLAPP
jgi:heme A synthase